MSDYFTASGDPIDDSLGVSSLIRAELAAVQTGLSDKIAAYTGNAGKIVRINSGGTGQEASDLEPISWTPDFTFAIPGDLAKTYTTQEAKYIKIARCVVAWFRLLTSSFTWSTASGDLQITGFPFALSGTNSHGSISWGGITAAGYTQMALRIADGTSMATVRASGSGQPIIPIQASHMPSGGTIELRGSIIYPTAS